MLRGMLTAAALAALLMPGSACAAPTVFPTGTTIYKPDKCWNGYTVLSNVMFGEHRLHRGVPLYDMNGNKVHVWKDVVGFPPLVMPGGKLLAAKVHEPVPQLGGDMLVELDFDSNVIWSYDGGTEKERKDPKTGKSVKVRSVQQHHNLVRWPQSAGYYAPGQDPDPQGDTLFGSYIASRAVGSMESTKRGTASVNSNDLKLVLTHDKQISWTWNTADYISDTLRTAGRPNPDGSPTLGGNSLAWLGPNKWFDQGDQRFHPRNLIMNNYNDTIYIVDHKTGDVVWQLGPDYSKYPQLAKLGLQLAQFQSSFGGQTGGMLHHAHMIPRGLPGEGNILVFNNGGNYSIVTEFNPVSLDVVWEYSGLELGYCESHSLAHYFFSPAISSAQRLPNGNTLITEGDGGRIFEVTPDRETVWEFINPEYDWPGLGWGRKTAEPKMTNMVYRAYRIPYEYVPQLPVPEQHPVLPAANTEFSIKPEPETVAYDRTVQDKVRDSAKQFHDDIDNAEVLNFRSY